MRIGICDDEQHDLTLLENYIHEFDESLEVMAFLSSSALIQAFDQYFFDLVFLDIEMGTPNGFQIAQILMSKADAPLIIFVTNSNDYTIRGYEVAFRYVKKPIVYETFCAAITAARDRITPQKISFIENGNTVILSIKDICYIEAFNYKATFHTVCGEYHTRMSLKNLEETLFACSFARPHKSYLVNLNFVNNAAVKEITMVDDTKIPIGRNHKKAFEQVLQQFIRG